MILEFVQVVKSDKFAAFQTTFSEYDKVINSALILGLRKAKCLKKGFR